MSATLTIKKTATRSEQFSPLDLLDSSDIRDNLDLTETDQVGNSVVVWYSMEIELDEDTIRELFDLDFEEYEIVNVDHARYGDIVVDIVTEDETELFLTDDEIEVLKAIVNPESNATLLKLVNALS